MSIAHSMKFHRVIPDPIQIPVIIVACGPSAEKLDLQLLKRAKHEGCRVIAVNRACYWMGAHATDWFTLDPDSRQVDTLRGIQTYEFTKWAAVPPDFGRPDARIGYHRITAPENVRYLHRIPGPGPFSSKYTLSTERDRIHTGNSAWGALGLAHLWNPEHPVALIGVDGTQETYAYAQNRTARPKTPLDHLEGLFASAIFQHKGTILNGSPDSRVRCFPRMNPNAAVLELLR